jgi:hypothetical protein
MRQGIWLVLASYRLLAVRRDFIFTDLTDDRFMVFSWALYDRDLCQYSYRNQCGYIRQIGL